MPKKSTTNRKRGLQRGVAKHKVRTKQETISLEAAFGQDRKTKEKFFGVPKLKIYKLAEIFFEIMYRACDKLYLIPYTRTDDGEYIELDRKDLHIHRLVVFVGFGILMQKLIGTLHFLFTEDLKIESFMCISLVLIYFVAFSISFGVLARPQETIDLLNAWPFILDCLKTITPKDIGPLDDVSTALKIIVLLPVTQGIGIAAMLSSLIIMLPVSLYPMLKNSDFIPDGMLSEFTWKLLFAPLEWIIYLPPMFVAPYSGGLLLISIGVVKTYTKHMRAVAISDLATRIIIERLYVCMELHNRVLENWLRVMVVPTLFSVSSTIIVTIFVTIRYTDLPVIFYMFFPYTGFTLMTIIFWICYDGTLILRDVEDVKGNLVSYETGYLRNMSKGSRTKIIARAKAMKQIDFPIGIFTEFSLSLPVSIWDEILNQIFFLLSF